MQAFQEIIVKSPKNGSNAQTILTIDITDDVAEAEIQELQKEIEHLLQLEKNPPLKADGSIDIEMYSLQLQARFTLQEKYKEKKQKFEETQKEQRQLAKIILSPTVKAECLRIKQAYGVPDDFDDRKINTWQIRRAEEEIAQCTGCTGLPCKKKCSKGFVPLITFDSKAQNIYISYQICAFELNRKVQAKIDKMQGLSKIPPEYVGTTFADYHADADNAYAIKAAKSLIEHPEKGAYFFGNVGTGKTFLAAIVAQEIIKRGRQVIFATIPTLSLTLRNTFNKPLKRNSSGEIMVEQSITEAEILEQLYTVPTLILDDVGMEKPTRFICSTIGNLINERYNSRLQTIMTSNYSLKDLEEIFNNPTDGGTTLDGTRIYDRCKQMCYPVEFKGNSRRA